MGAKPTKQKQTKENPINKIFPEKNSNSFILKKQGPAQTLWYKSIHVICGPGLEVAKVH